MDLPRWSLRIVWQWDVRAWGWDQAPLPSREQLFLTRWRRGPLLIFQYVPLAVVLAWIPSPMGPRGSPENFFRAVQTVQWCGALAFYRPDHAILKRAFGPPP